MTKKSTEELKDVFYPICWRSCSVIDFFGAIRCEIVCPNKFDYKKDKKVP